MNLVIISGMHRSGTSMFAQLLKEAGFYLGEELLPSSPHNPDGYFEDTRIVRFHEEILSLNDTNLYLTTVPPSWDVPQRFVNRARELLEDFEVRKLAAWKDPRASLFLPFWKKLIPEAHFVFLLRPPAHVVDSLYRRGDSSLQWDGGPLLGGFRYWKAARMWLAYNQRVAEFCSNYPEDTLVVSCYEVVNKQPQIEQVLVDDWSLPVDGLPASSVYKEQYLERCSNWRAKLATGISPSVNRLWDDLLNLAI